jgi:hypothetical protein
MHMAVASRPGMNQNIGFDERAIKERSRWPIEGERWKQSRGKLNCPARAVCLVMVWTISSQSWQSSCSIHALCISSL